MYSKIFIKLYVVLFVINLAWWGMVSATERASWFAFINLVALFVVLIQERHAFQDSGEERVLFTSDVFGFIALGVGLLGATWQANCGDLFSGANIWLVAVLIAGLFYVLSVWIFRMYSHQRVGHVPHVRVLTWVLAALFVYLMSSRVLPGNVVQQGIHDTTGWWNSFSSSVRTLIEPSVSPAVEDEIADISDLGVRDILEDVFDEEDKDDETDQGDQNGVADEDTMGNEIVGEVNQDENGTLTFGNFLPVLVEMYDLEVPTAPYTFTHVGVDSDLYDAFATARAYSMIGSATHPDQIIQCRHLMVLLGLAEGWELEYTANNVFDVYRAAAGDRGYTSTCSSLLQEATFADIPENV